MARNKFNHSHGDSGSKPPDGKDFITDEVADPQEFDWLFDNLTVVDGHADEFTRLDSNDDGVVDEADYANDADASTYKGNDIDSNGDGKVDSAVNADQASSAAQADTAALVDNTDIFTDYYNVSQSGVLPAGDAHSVWQSQLADGETLAVESATFMESKGTTLPSGCDLVIATLDGSGGGTVQTTVLAGGSAHLDVQDPASYTNSSGGAQHVAILVDNGNFNAGSGSDVDHQTTFIARVN